MSYAIVSEIFDAYLESWPEVVRRDSMPYARLKNPTEWTDQVAYLATLR
ncbi:hypothetical protein [Mesorhizobium hawassense]|nr:hypothetical protein [Mesorhizobium hawassense]